jgi:alpha-2-macroglobulin-like protein
VAVEDGKPLTGSDGKPLRGLGAGEFTLDAGEGGGEYALIVRDSENRFPPQERRFLVNKYEKPRLNKELEWGRKSYGPNDDVLANCRISRAEGGAPVANQPVVVSVTIDGQTYDAKGKPGAPFALRTDAEGKVNVPFHLPATIERGDASLSVNVTDGGSNETLIRPIPLVLKKLLLHFYPEGGDLVAGVPNRVYFEARTTLGKPAEVKGRLFDSDGKVVVDGVETLSVPDQPGANQGMGAFEFTPEVGKKYRLAIDSPIGIEGKHELPAVSVERVAMSIPAVVTTAAEPIRVTSFVHCGRG